MVLNTGFNGAASLLVGTRVMHSGGNRCFALLEKCPNIGLNKATTFPGTGHLCWTVQAGHYAFLQWHLTMA